MNPDDPRLTAYLLDELAPADCAEVRAAVENDPHLAAEIGAMRLIADQLRDELHAEEAGKLTGEQRDVVLASFAGANGAEEKKVVVYPPRAVWKGRVLRALAASIVIGVGTLALVGVKAYFGVKNRLSSSGISDPREPSELEFLAVRAGTKLTGRDILLEHQAEVKAQAAADRVAAAEWRRAQLASAATPQPSEPAASVSLYVRERDFAGGYLEQPRTATSFDYGDSNDTSPALAPSNPVGAAPIPADPYSNRTASAGRASGSLSGGASVRITSAGVKADKGEWQLGSDLTKSGSGSLTLSGTNTYTGQTTIAGGASGFGGRISSEGIDSVKVDSTRNTFASGTRIYDSRFDERAERALDTESYDAITDNAFLAVKDQPLSTFSIDVDTASYANVRRFLTAGQRPPRGAVRIEEMVNYFPYDYPQPAGDAPFSATMEVAACPWTPAHRLVRIGLKGRDVARSERPAANLVFLIDVSGSMQPANKLPLVKESLRLLIDQLDDRDQVAIAVYAGASGTVLEPTRDRAAMRAALDRLEAGGSTNGAGGIQLAYELAAKSFIKGGTNRVILATDGDFNVGITSQSDLVDLIEKKAKSGVFLSVLGYGMGNLKDSTLEKLADKGNGNYGYIDTMAEAKKTLVEQMNGTLITIAKDVKIQVEFNPAQAAAYRLIGYENRLLAKEDFNDDKKDAGEIGAGHSVTALYEVVPAGKSVPNATPGVDELKYSAKPATGSTQPAGSDPNDAFITAYTFTQKAEQAEAQGDTTQALTANREAKAILDQIANEKPEWKREIVEFRAKRTAEAIARLEKITAASAATPGQSAIRNPQSAISPELLTLKLRYKKPDGDVSTKLEFPLTDRGETWEKSSPDFRWAAAVASFGMLLRESPHKGSATWDSTLELAHEGRGEDRSGYRAECLALIEKARTIAR